MIVTIPPELLGSVRDEKIVGMSGKVILQSPLLDVPGNRPSQICALWFVQEAEISGRQDALGDRVYSRLLVVWHAFDHLLLTLSSAQDRSLDCS